MIRSLPLDIAVEIALSLEVEDVCALGSCCRSWREVCWSDYLWESLAKERWPSLPFLCNSESDSFVNDPLIKGWREIYVRLHKEVGGKANAVTEFVENISSPYGSIELGDYYKAIEDLHSMPVSFKDVEKCLFKPNLNVLVNVVGLLYCIFYLQVQVGCVHKSLLKCEISERQVCVRWWKSGRAVFRLMNEEPYSCIISLADLTTTSKGEIILRILRRGGVRRVSRVEIFFISNATN